MTAALGGFALGLSLIVAIGAQNAFILERGLARSHVFALCLVCALADAMLIAAGVSGLGSGIAARPALILAVTIGGAAFLGAYALFALNRALRPDAMAVRGERRMSLKAAAGTALALTFLNPHVYLDTVLLVGGLSARYGSAGERTAYGGGAVLASFIWFFALGYGARFLSQVFAKPAAWRVLDLAVAAVMATLAIGLLVSLF